MTNLRTLITAYRALRNAQRSVVLATVVETLASTYHKAGAHMLITEDGEFHGITGGGCFEGDCSNVPRLCSIPAGPLSCSTICAPEYELWGLGLGCNGAVRLLLQRLNGEQGSSLWRRWSAA